MKNFFTKLGLLLTVSAPVYVFAASPFLKPVKDLLGDLEIFIKFLNWAVPALAVIVFMVLVVLFILSKMQVAWAPKIEGKNIFWALVGLAVLFTVYGLIQLLGALVGVDTNRAKSITAPSLPSVGQSSGGGYYNQ